MQMGTRPANSQVQYTHYLMCNLDYRHDFILHTGSKITNDHAYKNSTCHQQGIVYKQVHVAVIQPIQYAVHTVLCMQKLNMDKENLLNVDGKNAEATNSLEVC